MSKRLVYNGVHRYPNKPATHIVCSYGTAIVSGLQRRGHNIEQWNFWHTDARQVPAADAYDGVIVSEVSQLALWRRVVPAWDWANKFSLFWCHGVSAVHQEQLDFAAANMTRTAATCPEVLAAWRWLYGEQGRPFLLSMLPLWSQWRDVIPVSPYVDTPAYLWAGRIASRSLQMLCEVARRLPPSRLHVFYNPRSELEWHQAGQLSEAAKALQRCGVTVHPPQSHGTFNEYYWHASVGLDVRPAVDTVASIAAMNCKVIDYVSAGLPIVGELNTHGDWLYRDRDWCRQVFPGDWEAYAAAIVELSEQCQNRRANQQEIRQQFDFEESLDVLSGELRRHGF